MNSDEVKIHELLDHDSAQFLKYPSMLGIVFATRL
jgi:hypothetical protein